MAITYKEAETFFVKDMQLLSINKLMYEEKLREVDTVAAEATASLKKMIKEKLKAFQEWFKAKKKNFAG